MIALAFVVADASDDNRIRIPCTDPYPGPADQRVAELESSIDARRRAAVGVLPANWVEARDGLISAHKPEGGVWQADCMDCGEPWPCQAAIHLDTADTWTAP